MTDAPDLLPCPFCGGAAELQKGLVAFDDYEIHCGGCGMAGPSFGAMDVTPSAKAESIAAWNTRATPRVKPLVWEELGGGFWRAPLPLFGNVRVDNYGAYEVTWSIRGFCDTFTPGQFPTDDAAKAAAQADFTARILAALDMGEV